MKLPDGKTRLDLVRQGLGQGGIAKRGRLIVSVEKLLEDPRNERKTFRNMAGLVASVKAVGLIEPITVTPEGDDAYRIVTGHRRYRAAKLAGLSQVEILIRDQEDEHLRRRKSIVSNVQREDIGPVEIAEALQALLDEDKAIASQDELAKAIGKDKTWVSGMLRILTLPPALQKKVGLTQLSVPYDAMIRIARLEEPGLQAELIEALLGGATQREIRQRIDQHKGKPPADKSSGEQAPKPKRVFHTEHKASVIVQGTTSKALSAEQCVRALREALFQASAQAASET